jgi:hypothetical protein
MQGFQPVYSGNNLTQAWRSAGEFQMQGARATAAAYESIGKSIGGALRSVGSSIAGAMGGDKANNAVVPESQVKAAEAAGISFPGRDRSDAGPTVLAPVTQGQFNLGLENQSKLLDLESASVRLGDARQTLNLNLGGFSYGAAAFPFASLPQYNVPINPAFK